MEHRTENSPTWPIIFGILVGFLSLIYFLTRKKVKHPMPEVKGHFIRGYEPALYPRAYKGFMKLKKDHPDIVTVHIGFTKFIFVMSYRAMVETFVTKADNFSGRPTNPVQDAITKKAGLIMVDGTLWKNHRRFALKVLRDFGFGRNLSEEIVHSEIRSLLSYIDKERLSNQQGIDTLNLLLRSVSNVICTLTLGEQPGYEEKEFMEVVNRMRANIEDSPFKTPITVFPFMMPFFPLLRMLPTQVKSAFDNIDYIASYIDTKIKKHMDEFDPEHEPRDYIDAFLLEQYRENKRQNGGQHSFTTEQLEREILDLFVAGTDTTSNSLAWGLLLLALNPQIQKRCHEEIDAQIEGRTPSMKDKNSTPYILAVMDEVQRLTTLVPMALIHRNFKEDEVMGYTVPANSMIIPFIYGVHHDDKVWEKPSEFYPEHFLTKDGLHYQTREELIPFSVGKRSCLGESLARMELYLFFVSVLQRFTVKLNAEDEQKLDEIMLGTEGIILSPGKHRIVFEARG